MSARRLAALLALAVAVTISLPAGTADAAMARLFPQAHPYEADPVGWVRDKLGENLWSKQCEIAQSVVENEFTAVPSCHGAGKSYLASRIALWWIDAHPVGDAFVVTTAPTANQVNKILWREIRKGHIKGALPGRIAGGTGTSIPEWSINGVDVAYGRKPETLEGFQGMHAPYVLVIVDEGGAVPDWLIEGASTIATNPVNDRVLVIGNPTKPASAFEKICKPGSLYNKIQIPAASTPRFTGEECDPAIPLVTPLWVEQRAYEWGVESGFYQSRVDAVFPDVSDDTLFPPKLILRALATDLPGMDRGGYGGDVARYGENETVVYRARGGVARHVKSIAQSDTYETAELFSGILRQHGADRPPMVVDADGIGIGVVDIMRKHGVRVVEFHGGERASDPGLFVNRRAEVYWTARQMAENGELDLEEDTDAGKKLVGQLQALKFKYDGKGRIQIESKEDMRARGVKSPDHADAAVMALSAPSGNDLSVFGAAVVHTTDSGTVEGSLSGDLLERAM